jgi:hypothetical protein
MADALPQMGQSGFPPVELFPDDVALVARELVEFTLDIYLPLGPITTEKYRALVYSRRRLN